MRTVANTETVKIKVTKDELLEKKWLNFILLSKKITQYETENNIKANSLRTRFYNSDFCEKYNTTELAGIKCIDADNPMKSQTASLVIEIEKV